MASCKGLGGLNDLEQGPQTDVAGVKYSSVEPLATKNHPSRSPGPAKPLWDPNNDDPTTRRTTRRDRQSGHVNKLFRHPHSSRELRSKPRKPDVVREWSNVANLQEQTLSTDPYVTQFDSSRKPRILGKQKLPPGDEPSEGFETLPEMLLQSDTRPISHAQLVQEMKGIYTSLIMMEAKCIDIDERQSAAAQEKDPSKKTDLKNDQWQSLIALHKQVLHEHHNSVESHSRVGSLLRTKQGLVGFANGSSIVAMADTGSRKNIMSASYAKKLDVKIEGLPSTFAIGNSRKIQSVGIVSLHWSFADKPKESFRILCHVIPSCTYDLILGNSFLTATKTLTEFCHRLTKCFFRVVNNIWHFNFLGETCQRLHGNLADKLSVFAIPDTGAERNVMSLQYAVEHGLEIKTGPKHCGYLQFADGSYDVTVGQVETHWTFATGERIPVTFEVLEYCCSDVIIGEEILTEHNVFQRHEASIFQIAAVDDDCFELAPFDFVNSWQKGCEKLMLKAGWRREKDDSYPRNGATSENAHFEEQHRRNVWNHKYAFGTKASLGEGELERARRERYESLHGSRHLGPMGDQTSANGNGDQQTEQRVPVIPSIPTSQTPR